MTAGGGASTCLGNGGTDTELPWSTHLDTTMANWVYPGGVRVDTAGNVIVLSTLDGSDFGSGPIAASPSSPTTPPATSCVAVSTRTGPSLVAPEASQ